MNYNNIYCTLILHFCAKKVKFPNFVNMKKAVENNELFCFNRFGKNVR